jgi:UDP-N-acetylmuramoyl-tripeptide--D-alanyl-D-alanine ligase
MYPFSASRLAAGLKGSLLKAGSAATYTRLSTDTRTLKRGDAYLALQGERFDGEKFYRAALKAGAAALVGRRPPLAGRAAAIRVDDGLASLQALASDQRRLFEGRVFAITGSNGKTGTKECLAYLLGAGTLSTPGNWNNHVGLPLTLLRLEPGHKAAVLELGMNHAGELKALAAICRPDIALELNVGDAHLGHFKSRAAVAAAKEELLQGLGSAGIAVINGDDDLVAAMGRRRGGRVLSFGFRTKNGLRAHSLEDFGAQGARLALDWQGRSFKLKLAMGGRAKIYQALASLAAALAAGREMKPALARLERFKPQSPGRQEIKRWCGVNFILDAYNASPQSMDAALELLALSAPKGKRLAVLGDMLELGGAARGFQRELGRKARQAGLRDLAALGPNAQATLDGFRGGEAFGREEAQEAAAWLRERAEPGDWVLLKGSRGMAVERVFNELTLKG